MKVHKLHDYRYIRDSIDNGENKSLDINCLDCSMLNTDYGKIKQLKQLKQRDNAGDLTILLG